MMLQSASGGVDMARCQGIVAVQTASGHIRARELRLTADARFESSSGGIDVDLVNDLSDLTYRLTSSSGRIRFGDIEAGNHLTGGSGRFLIEARTASGAQTFR